MKKIMIAPLQKECHKNYIKLNSIFYGEVMFVDIRMQMRFRRTRKAREVTESETFGETLKQWFNISHAHHSRK